MLDGPRLRDRISHCEMAPEIISVQIAGLVTHIVLRTAFSYHFHDQRTDQEPYTNALAFNSDLNNRGRSKQSNCASIPEKLSPRRESSNLRYSGLSIACQQLLKSFEHKLDSYNSLFHPICAVARIGRSCIKKLAKLRSISYPSEFATEIDCFETNAHHSYYKPLFASLSNDPEEYFKHIFVNNVKKLKKEQQEILVVLRHVATECYEASRNIVSFAQERLQAYGMRKLRSRQRSNYKSFILR